MFEITADGMRWGWSPWPFLMLLDWSSWAHGCLEVLSKLIWLLTLVDGLGCTFNELELFLWVLISLRLNWAVSLEADFVVGLDWSWTGLCSAGWSTGLDFSGP